MFSGIIESLGTILTVNHEPNAMVIEVATGISDLSMGESVAVNGVCLTVVQYDTQGKASFFISSETLNRTNLNTLHVDKRVNLERAVTPSTRLSGHIVQGHVDATGRFLKAEQSGDAYKVFFAFPASLRKYVVEKGSIAIDGTSLTLNGVGEIGRDGASSDEFIIHIMIIPHTWEYTTLGHLSPDDMVNVEVDIIAKYVENLCLVQK
ncbi:Riboflavin synthase alpha chain (RibC) (PDB:1I8D) [Commensalibacter communis]|uniref:riboflavin synthase n=1 Tax=Commensalibacter communis TaxID=2972786 RepID=UPI0022FF729F|nr:riboflavin synthase [Commensalibacter communis]CAI3952174.1 Riboflavin synthase alpha chain (RibC) (PDB:1I8D) [Commensalibacter communis]CAI3952258.1 Riboflavin synthase alpha chain (RibC) (PDB:1I8D) [Commensalibacter communis]